MSSDERAGEAAQPRTSQQTSDVAFNSLVWSLSTRVRQVFVCFWSSVLSSEDERVDDEKSLFQEILIPRRLFLHVYQRESFLMHMGTKWSVGKGKKWNKVGDESVKGEGTRHGSKVKGRVYSGQNVR